VTYTLLFLYPIMTYNAESAN